MRILQSTEYTLYIDGLNVTMVNNQNRMPYSLSSLMITTHDVLFYMATQHMGYDEKAERLKHLIIGTFDDNLDRLNKITHQNFKPLK